MLLMPRSPEPARRQILDSALRLFAMRGISGVSLREIRLAANQGNAAALQYHFGTKDGLLRALLERELPLLVDRRRALLGLAQAGAQDDVRSVAAVFVLPYAQLATGSSRERHVVQFLSQLHDDVSLSVQDIQELIGDTATAEAGRLLAQRISPSPGAALLAERVRVGTNSYLHAAAIWARGERREHQVSDATFRANLVDMFLGALVAPVTGDDEGRHP
jgi:AcrR family transcriptional regulator